MKKTNLKILFTALSFSALSVAFGQDTSKSVTSGDSLNRVAPQASPMATDSSKSVTTDSTSAGYDKADKKRLKAQKKEMKAENKEAGK